LLNLLSSPRQTKAQETQTVNRTIIILLGGALFGAVACDACDRDTPGEEIREDLEETRENVEDAVDMNR
jgi:hypothetical protein